MMASVWVDFGFNDLALTDEEKKGFCECIGGGVSFKSHTLWLKSLSSSLKSYLAPIKYNLLSDTIPVPLKHLTEVYNDHVSA